MKKIFYSLFAVVTMLCAMESSAQTDIWAWKNGQYTKFEKADSITFVDPEAVTSNVIDGHEYVDLGLPSGLKWATCNVGANNPEEYGDYFAWGETEPKEGYSLSTYKWCNNNLYKHTKYCVDSFYGTVDSLTTLLAEDDAATAKWGVGWRMPTTTEQEELHDGCDWEWTDEFNGSGVSGQVGTSKANGNTIFLPAAGSRHGTNIISAGYYGDYWSSSLSEDRSNSACYLDFLGVGISKSNEYRYYGHSVRAVVK